MISSIRERPTTNTNQLLGTGKINYNAAMHLANLGKLTLSHYNVLPAEQLIGIAVIGKSNCTDEFKVKMKYSDPLLDTTSRETLN